MTEYAGSVEDDNILTGSGGVGGPNCPGKEQKPNAPEIVPVQSR